MYEGLQVEHSSTVDRVADELRHAILDGRLGPGTPLREVALCDVMGVARSTIREALSVLVSEGLAVRVAHKGVAVKSLSAEDVADVSRARVAVEVAGVRRWADATDEERSAVRKAFESYRELAEATNEAAALTEAHLRIHRALVGLTGSQRLLAAADAYSAELRLGLAHLDYIRGNLQEQIDSHQALVDLLESGDIEAAAAELIAHLTGAEESLRDDVLHGTIEP